MAKIKGAPKEFNTALETLWALSHDAYKSHWLGEEVRESGFNTEAETCIFMVFALPKDNTDPADAVSPPAADDAYRVMQGFADDFKLEIITREEAENRGYGVQSAACYYISLAVPKGYKKTVGTQDGDSAGAIASN